MVFSRPGSALEPGFLLVILNEVKNLKGNIQDPSQKCSG